MWVNSCSLVISCHVTLGRCVIDKNNAVSRRDFLANGSLVTAASALRLTGSSLAAITQAACSARDERAAFSVLTDGEARQLSAIAARIIPTTDTPGANEAGVVYFFDNILGSDMNDRLPIIRESLATFSVAVTAAHPTAQSFADLEVSEQDAFLKTQETTGFFGLVAVMTKIGFFAMAKHGGNKDNVSWGLVDYQGHHTGGWQYPFGYYDAVVHGGDADE
jgi:hypothetical protein